MGNRSEIVELKPDQLSIRDRLRRLPAALLLAGVYYASRSPVLGDLIRRLD